VDRTRSEQKADEALTPATPCSVTFVIWGHSSVVARLLPPGLLEVCAIGILIWLNAKWRRSVNVNR
jgi:hypothetical protein